MRSRLLNFTVCLAITLAAFTFAASAAKADAIYDINVAFQSGTTFTGTVTFSDDLSTMTGVDGTLNGYTWTPAALTALPTTLSGSDHIGWVWPGGCGDGSECLMDSPSQNYVSGVTNPTQDTGFQYWIWLYWNSSTGTPVITSDATDTTEVSFDHNGGVNDPMKSSTLTRVPEPATLAMVGSGLLSLGFFRRKLFS